jgi:hypothetical protein
MSNRELNPYKVENSEKNKEKIFYSDNTSVCFACGEKIKDDIDICPYCNTPIK